ncbi:hypothetical protein [Pseudomonas sp. o96-267]|uniref:hypothetical protein n=1 Tax=Pseudomonas sp. o96-267 TaxID=2479853 RepID=UPI000F79A671|nr:hypothetical protein [Pseudomonas sp. o96-267]
MNTTRQKGQAMVFGLLFIGIAAIALILMFNQGILTRDRVQVENAADAAAYSQAKLFARHQNLIAYTNRAIIANELSIGQVVALMSWSKRYANIPRWVNSFPAYQIPIIPIIPKPMISDVLSAVTLPYQLLGMGTRAVSTPIISIYPQVVSSFNIVMGFFQKAFAIATFEAQVSVPKEVVTQHRMRNPNDQLEVAPLSQLFLIQNFILTYFADYLPIDALLGQLTSAMSSDANAGTTGGNGQAGEEDPNNFLADFLGSHVPSSMLVNTAPELHNSRANSLTGEDARSSAREFAAILNTSRNDWLSQRNFDAAVGFTSPEIPLLLGFINIRLQFGFEVGVFNNGGTAYVFNPLTTNSVSKGVPTYGWASIDFSSMGAKFSVDLMIELCLPLVGCVTILDDELAFGFGLPLGGATHQLATNPGDQFLFGPQWGTPTQGMFGSKPKPYGEALHPVHATTWAWGNVLSVFGLNQAEDVNLGYSGSPSFFSLGADHAETGRSKEFTVAVAKPLANVRTSDNPASLNLRQGRFALDTQGVHDNPLIALWGDGERMMTVSSAETYFAPPPGRTESPTQYSPFWDARLREPSKVVEFIASGKIDILELLGLNSITPSYVAGFLLDLSVDYLIKPGRDRLTDQMPAPLKPIAKPIVDGATDSILDTVVDAIKGAME